VTTAPPSNEARPAHGSARAAFDELCTLLTPVRQGTLFYSGEAPLVDWGVPYGGLLVGQALAAAADTVPEGQWIRSLHAYFLQVGRGDESVDIEVRPVHAGRSSSWRTIEVLQRERLLLRMDAMFGADGQGPTHQAAMPPAPAPESLPNIGTQLSAYSDTFRPWDEHSPFDLRYVSTPPRLQDGAGAEAASRVWLGPAGTPPRDRALAAALLAYSTDMCLLDACIQPHGLWFGQSASGFSLDHSIWFHAPARVDDWLLLDQRSPGQRDGRGLSNAQLFARDGELLCSVAQLGSIRPT